MQRTIYNALYMEQRASPIAISVLDLIAELWGVKNNWIIFLI